MKYAILFALFLPVAAGAADITIAPQSLSSALQSFSAQSGLQVGFAAEIARDLRTRGIQGAKTPAEALAALLADTSLEYHFVNTQTVIIRQKGGGAPSGRNPPGARADEGAAHAPGMNFTRLTLADTRAEPAPPAELPEKDRQAPKNERMEDEMLVTGSQIRGVRNETVPVLVLDRDYIERSGFSNTMQLVETLPQNFKGGTTGASEEGIFGDGAAAGQNLSRGTGLNLRGLGAVSTLTLINGRRVAPSAQGQFVDVSTIPITAVERVEILTDGASALYGADAVAGVVNIILRKDYEGLETALRYGAATRGGAGERRLSQTFGHHWERGSVLVMGEYNRRHSLDVRDRDFVVRAGAPGPNDLLPERTLYSLVANFEHHLTETLDVNANLLFSRESVDSLTSGIGALGGGGSTTIVGTLTRHWSAAAGLGYEPFGDWRFAVEGSLGQSHPDSDVDEVDLQTGVLSGVWEDFIKNFKTWEFGVKADGTLFRLPGGPVRVGLGGAHRKEDFLASRYSVRYDEDGNRTGRVYSVRADDERDVSSAFAEVYVPLIGAGQDLRWARRLDLSLAGRYDRYSDFGGRANPKYGVVWSPGESVDVRATYSTSFRVPNVWEKSLGAGPQFIFSDLFDGPDGAPGAAPFLVLSGSTALGPEKSRNLVLGFSHRPASLHGLEWTLNYFSIDYRGRISTPPYDYGALSRRADFGSLVRDFASDEEAQAFLDERIAMGDIFFDFIGTGDATGVLNLFDFRQQNAARTLMSGIDLTATYTLVRDADLLDLSVNVAHIRNIRTSLTAASTRFDDLDVFQRPLDWRVRVMGTWSRGGLNATVAVNYADGYVNNSLFFDEPVGSWTTADLNLSYDLGRRPSSSWPQGKLALNISNLTDEEPPYVTDALTSLGFDVSNANALGRFVSFQYTRQW